MKKIIFIILVSLITGCEDFLQEVPKDRLSENNFYSTKIDAQAAVDAIYPPLRNAFRTLYLLMLDIQADYANGRGSTMPLGEYQGFDQTNINRAATMWGYFYQGIRNANIVLDKVPEILMDETKKASLLAEARFLRAYYYYHLVRNFGAVPVYLENGEEKLSRQPVAEVYQLIIEDIKIGEVNLPESPSAYGHPTKWSAKAFLSEVYLTIGEWQLARDKAKEIIDNGPFSLVGVSVADDFDKVFGPLANGTSEEIFYLKYNNTDGWEWPQNLLWSETLFSPFGNYVIYSVPGPFFSNWDNNDLRKKWGVFSEYISSKTGKLTTLPSSTPILCSKFRDPKSPSRAGHGNDYPIFRLADVLLIYAEASVMAENNVSAEALECLNKVKRRAYGYPYNSASAVDFPGNGWTADSFRETVVQERAYELYMEGKRWFDLKRLGTAKLKEIIMTNTGKTVKDKHLLWPIPQQEIDTNPEIDQEDQNPEY
jgi:hypothetical protein